MVLRLWNETWNSWKLLNHMDIYLIIWMHFYQSPKHEQASPPLMESGKLSPTSFTNAAHSTAVTLQFLRLGWWALFTAPLPFSLKVLGFHQLKKSRQGQGRWMTSMASRYYQGRVIETNEPCYISWWYWILLLKDPELDRAETRGTQPFHRSPVSWGPRRRAFSESLLHWACSFRFLPFYVQVHSHILLFGLQIFSSLSLPGAEREN